MLYKIIRYIGFTLKQAFFYLLSMLIPKEPNLWVFGAWQGKIYADNSKYLFEYVNMHQKQIHCVWITKNKNVCKSIAKKGMNAYCLPSLKAYFTLLRATVVIQTEGNRDIGGFRLCRTKVIQLWHGVAPKKVNWNSQRSMVKKHYDSHFIDNHGSSYWMASSKQNKKTLHELFGADLNRTFVTGYPRNDIFARKDEKSFLYQALDEKYPDSLKIIYMPTHRNFGLEGRAFSECDLLKLDSRLQENNYVMVFKPHFHELLNYLNIEDKFTNIVLAKEENMYCDVYSYIKDFDLLISDYSSIVYDFLCTHKPIVLFPYDLERFKNTDAGLFDYYESIPAGPFCFSWDDVMDKVEKLFTDDTEWIIKREKCRNTFHPFADGKNRERVYDTIMDILKSKK